jgi:hypothetical protein
MDNDDNTYDWYEDGPSCGYEDDLQEMGDREAWEDAQGEQDYGDLYDLEDEDTDDQW